VRPRSYPYRACSWHWQHTKGVPINFNALKAVETKKSNGLGNAAALKASATRRPWQQVTT
jgi:hypothetical protein